MKRFLDRVLSLIILSFLGSAVSAQAPAIRQVKVRIEPRTDLGELHGRAELVAEDSLDYWELDAQFMTIDGVQAGYFNYKHPLLFTHEAGKLRVEWKGVPRDGRMRRVFITYRAVPPELQGRNLGKDLKKEGIVLTNPNPPLPEDPLASPLEYQRWASQWVPLVDAPNQRFELLLALYVPKKIEVRACGEWAWDVADDDHHLVVYTDERQSPATLFWAIGKERVIENKEEVLAVAAKQFDLDRIEMEQRLKLQRLQVLNQTLSSQAGRLSGRTGRSHRWGTIQEQMVADSSGYWAGLYERAQGGMDNWGLQQELTKRWFYEVLADTSGILAQLAMHSLVADEPLLAESEFENRMVYQEQLKRVDSFSSGIRLFLMQQEILHPEGEKSSAFWKAYFGVSPVTDEEGWASAYIVQTVPEGERAFWLSILKNKQVPLYRVNYRWVAGTGEILEIVPLRAAVHAPVQVRWSSKGRVNEQAFVLDSAATKWVLPSPSIPDRVQVDPSGWLPVLWEDHRPETFLLGQLQQGNELERWEAYGILLNSPNSNLRSTVMGIALDEPVIEFRRMALEAATKKLDATARKKLGPTLERIAAEDPVEELRKMAGALVGG